MKLEGTTLANATPLEISIEGEWSPAPDLRTPLSFVDGKWVPAPNTVTSCKLIDGQTVRVPYEQPTPIICVDGQWIPAPCREWHGWATSSEPFVALALHRTSDGCRWVKVGHAESKKSLRLDLTPGEPTSVQTWIDREIVHTSVKASSPYYRPEVENRRQFRGGVFESLARIDGEPSLETLILFLAKRDVRTTRNGLWHVRSEIAESIASESMRRMLTYGRTGNLEID